MSHSPQEIYAAMEESSDEKLHWTIEQALKLKRYKIVSIVADYLENRSNAPNSPISSRGTRTRGQ